MAIRRVHAWAGRLSDGVAGVDIIISSKTGTGKYHEARKVRPSVGFASNPKLTTSCVLPQLRGVCVRVHVHVVGQLGERRYFWQLGVCLVSDKWLCATVHSINAGRTLPPSTTFPLAPLHGCVVTTTGAPAFVPIRSSMVCPTFDRHTVQVSGQPNERSLVA